MITIIPNWHPIFVHFTIGLLGTAVVFYFASALLKNDHRWKQQWQHMANWSLWSGCLITIGTVLAGWYAYNTVAHDEASHAAMTIHRNWALATAVVFVILGIAAIIIVKNKKTPHYLFLSVASIAGAMLIVTGFLGGEVVYRHGLGVLSLPVAEAGDHHHNHDHNASNEHEHGTDHQHGEAATESEPHHHDHDMESSKDMNTEANEHSHSPQDESTAPHEHQH